MQQSETLFCFSNSERKQKLGIFTRGIRNRDTPRFVLKNRDIPIKSGSVAGLDDVYKQYYTLPGNFVGALDELVSTTKSTSSGFSATNPLKFKGMKFSLKIMKQFMNT